MIVTEEEAKTKRCQESFGPPLTQDGHVYASAPPFYASAPPYVSAYNYGSGSVVQTSPSMCIGSACMAWRWGREDLIETIGTGSMVLIKPGQGEYSATHGFCGKAGKP